MATTWIRPVHKGKGKSVTRTLIDTIGYADDPEKSNNFEYVKSYGCDYFTAAGEFALAKQLYEQRTGRGRDKGDIIAYHLRQSFKPGEKENETGKARLNLSEVIGGVVRLYAPILARKKTGLKTEIPGDTPDVYANAGEITQVLFNLLQNARNHTENGNVMITAEKDGDFTAVTISDTGAGFPPDILPRAFERGVTGGEDGSGIGLAICKEIIGGHGGIIEIENRQSGGAAVRFTLPIDRKEGDYGDGTVG
jgi:signal transduction histidine kinase